MPLQLEPMLKKNPTTGTAPDFSDIKMTSNLINAVAPNN